MFSSFRRKQRKQPQPQAPLRPSPSLPNLPSTPKDIQWPENLVDVQAVRESISNPPTTPERRKSVHAEKSALPSFMSFHKPFKAISSLYAAGPPPSAFDNWKGKSSPVPVRYSQRRAKAPPSFNLMVAGGRGTGKSSLLRLVLETADVSPGATADQRAALDQFLKHTSRIRTRDVSTACVEILESKWDRCLLTVIDTPGLDYRLGQELKLRRQVDAIMKYIDSQYADTMCEESKVVRKSSGDQHIHCCIYMVDPTSVMTPAERRDLSSLPSKNPSEVTVSANPPDLVPDTSDGDESDEDGLPKLTMSPAELHVIKRLATRINLIPVIAHADSLTDQKLKQIKDAVRRGMAEAGLNDGIFGTSRDEQAEPLMSSADSMNSETDDGSDEERPSRPIIKLRPSRHRPSSRSRSRPPSPDLSSQNTVAGARFSAQVVAQTDLSHLVPFAIIAPETGKRIQHQRPMSVDMSPPSEDGHAPSHLSIQSTPQYAPPEPLKGVFVRKFRWGTVDVLNPDHCDFAALRTTVFSTHFKALKVRTKEVLYEQYRTEKLLARRATEKISDEQRQRLLHDLGI